jgi:hypothetical protein
MKIVPGCRERRRTKRPRNELQKMNLFVTLSASPGVNLIDKGYIVEMEFFGIDANNRT